MHDDLCLAHATGRSSRLSLHCWREPGHGGDHHDRDLGVYWRHAPGQTTRSKPRYMPPWRTHKPQLVIAGADCE